MNLARQIPPQNRLLAEVSRRVTEITGVQLGPNQEAMIRSRLTKRFLELGFIDDQQYLEYFLTHLKTEIPIVVSLLTTHHTFFFREFPQFEFLDKTALPELIQTARRQGRTTLRFWSAACSRGQEVYSLSMFLAHHLNQLAPEMRYEIVGTDVDSESIAVAKNGVYAWKEIKEVPSTYLSNHWARGTGAISEFVKAKGSIKEPCTFTPGNLLETRSYPSGPFDVIFCRNVFIYFTPEQVKSITMSLLEHLAPHGHLIVGLSESLHNLGLPINHVGPSIVRHPGAIHSIARAVATPTVPPPTVKPTTAPSPVERPIRVLCVDDSPVILTLLKKILSPQYGFEVVATAQNGLEAAGKLKEHQVDLVTLDIHMPEQTGVQYLQRNFRPGHPPVVIISSVTREDSDLAIRCINLGAVDYVEKPALANLEERSAEIHTKLRCAFKSRFEGTNVKPTINQEFQRKLTIPQPEKKLRIIFAAIADHKKLRWLFDYWSGAQPPTVVLFEGAQSALESLSREIKLPNGELPTLLEGETPPPSGLAPGMAYFGDFATQIKWVNESVRGKPCSVIVLGDVSRKVPAYLSRWAGPHTQIVLEEPVGGKSESQEQILKLSQDEGPYTSLGYLSDEFLSRG